MPGFDGTGPDGRGPLTGRRKGYCASVVHGAARNAGKAFWPMIMVAAAGAVVKDMQNPKGLTRSVIRLLGSQVKKKLYAHEDA